MEFDKRWEAAKASARDSASNLKLKEFLRRFRFTGFESIDPICDFEDRDLHEERRSSHQE